MSADFVHLRVRSEYSLQTGVARVTGDNSAPARAARLGMAALGIADSGNLFGALKFCETAIARGVKPVIGCEAAVLNPSRPNAPEGILLLCQDDTGYRNLCRLLTRQYAARGRTLAMRREWLSRDSCAGLIALSGASEGEVGALVKRGRIDEAARAARRWSEIFPDDRFCLEIWRAGLPGDEEVAAGLSQIAAERSMPLVAGHPVAFTEAEDFEALEARACIINGWLLADENRKRPFSREQYLLSAAEMKARFADLPAAVANSVEIARRCNFCFDAARPPAMPQIPLPPGRSADDELAAVARARLSARAARADEEKIAREYAPRLEEELRIVAKTGFASYFLIVAEIVNWAKGQGVPVGPGRGSGAGSLIAWALGITEIDPIAHGLLFERFLNPERVSIPDFDIDFCPDRRGEVIDHARQTYGKHAVAQIVTFGTLGAKAAVRDLGRVLGMPLSQTDRLARLIPNEIDITLAAARKKTPELEQAIAGETGVARLFELAAQLEGLPRNIGTHAGGVIIAPGRLDDFCPLYAAQDTDSLVCQFDKDDCEKIGLVKFDFLGVSALTVLDSAAQMLRAQGGATADFDWDQIAADDPAACGLYARAQTLGVFQCDSSGMRELMRRVAPDSFSQITALMALYRPGPLESGMVEEYIARRHGRAQSGERPDFAAFDEPAARAALADTYGVVVYQEQVMELARRLAGYSMGEADLLRRAMGKKKPEEMSAHEARFVDAAAIKIGKTKARRIFRAMEKFSGYGFNKSHAAAYGLVSYRGAYLKAHYPAVFYAATMSVESGNTDKLRDYLRDAVDFGVEILPPDINDSGVEFAPRGAHAARYGLAAIRGIGREAAREIVELRDDGAFTSLFDFCRRACARDGGQLRRARAAIECLAFAGAFDSLHPNRAAVVETLPAALAYGEETLAQKNQPSLSQMLAAPQTLADRAAWPPEILLTHERRALGYCLTGHFFRVYDDFLRDVRGLWKISDVVRRGEGGAVTIAGVIEARATSGAMRRAGLEALILDDTSERIEILFSREIWRALNFADELATTAGESLLIVEGAVRSNPRGEPALRVARAWSPKLWIAERAARATIEIDSYSRALLPPAAANGGGCALSLRYRNRAAECRIDLGGKFAVDFEWLKTAQARRGAGAVRMDYRS